MSEWMEEYMRRREEKAERLKESWLRNLGYIPEPEPYREGLVKSMEYGAMNGCRRIREDLEPQDSSVGLKLVRVGSYRAGVENSRWDGRFRNGHRNYDVEGDYYLEQRREEIRKWRQEFDERRRENPCNGPIMNDVFGPILQEAMMKQILEKKPVVKETLAVDRSVPTPGWSMMRCDEWMREGRI